MKIKDGIMGFVVGDALGVPVEFISRLDLQENPIVDMVGFGTYNMPPGTFSDDSSLTIATIQSIITNNGEIIYKDILDEFVQWYINSKYTQYNNTFDVGRTTAEALENFIRGNNPTKSGLSGMRDNGNGSLMRILPLAFIDNIDYKTIEDISSLTHAHIISKIACVFYIELVKSILDSNKQFKEHVLYVSQKIQDYYQESEYLTIFKNIFNGTIMDEELDNIKSSGYVLDTLEAVIYVLANTNNYKEAVLKAVNLGGDTDTIAAIVGGVAGILYGFENIPKEWINKIKDSDKILELCVKYETVIN